MLARVLIVSSPRESAGRIPSALASSDTLVFSATCEEEMWERLGVETFDMVVLSEPAVQEPLIPVIERIRALPEHPDVVILGRSLDPASRAELTSTGCLAVVDLELDEAVLQQTLRALVERRREERGGGDAIASAQEPFRLANFVSRSPTMQRFLSFARRVVRSDSTLLILGETGVGKEWLARAIHEESPRAGSSMIAVNCAALSESLLETELFGHAKGAFTGASRSRRGHFELAHGGTIFLDEIAELPAHLQAKLLRVLEERHIQPVGSERSIEVDVRVMAATNRDLEAEIREKRFRADLYYRLNVVSLTVPALHDRVEDIPVLAEHYIQELRTRIPHEVVGIDRSAMEALIRYPWPGNVRELRNALERAILLCGGEQIELSDLPVPIAACGPSSLPAVGESLPHLESDGVDWRDLPWAQARRKLLDAAERAYFVRLLQQSQGRLGQVARRAAIDPRSLYEKMRRYGLRKEDFRGSAPGARRELEPEAHSRRL